MTWTPTTRTWLRRVATAAVLLAALLGLWRLLRDLDVELVARTLATSAPEWVCAAIACGLLAQVSRAVGWRSLLPVRIGFPRLVAYEFVAQAASAVSPEGSGELVRVSLLRRDGVGSTTTVTLMVVRKLFSSLGLVPLLVLLAGLDVTLRQWAFPSAASYVLVLAIVCAVVARASRPVEPGTAAPGKFAARLREARATLEVLKRPRALAGVAASSLLTRLLDLGALLLLAHGLSLQVPAGVGVLVLLLVEVSNVLPTAPGQLGTFEVAALTALVGTLRHEDAVALTLAFHAQQLLPQAVVGALLVLTHLTRRAARTVVR